VKQDERRIWAGLLVRRERWSLTSAARLLVLAVLAGAMTFLILEAHSFLAPTERVPSDILVIEGWAAPYSMKQAANEFISGRYHRAILVRPIADLDDKYESGRDAGDVLVSLLIKYGVPPERITALYPRVVKKDRTYHSALEVKKCLAEQGPPVNSLDLMSAGPHARRSRLLYEKAFGGGAKIGIIAMENMEYDKAHWWRVSEGVRDVLGESIAYIYARFFFRETEI
jgi:hypothetical protein